MKLLFSLLMVFIVNPAFADDEKIIEFVIKDGTGDKPWNTMETAIEAPMGSTIRFINEDSIRHRLHTAGAPCPHGPNFGPGETWDCKVTREFSASSSGPLYDHNFGPKAEVWIEIVEEEPEVIEFVIPAGTGDKPWNTMETAIEAPMGSTIRFINEDSIRHRLHTNGAPCSHGPNFEPGETWDCKVTRIFSASSSGPLYDHNFGPKAEVWIEILEEVAY